MAFEKGNRPDSPMKRRGGRRRKKVCVFCGKENNEIDYKDVAKSELKKWLGLGARAYDNTSYLPSTGGTLTGNLNGTTAIFCGRIYDSGGDNE